MGDMDLRGAKIEKSVLSSGDNANIQQNNTEGVPDEFKALVEELKAAIAESSDEAQKAALESQLPALEHPKDKSSVEKALGVMKTVADTMTSGSKIVSAVDKMTPVLQALPF